VSIATPHFSILIMRFLMQSGYWDGIELVKFIAVDRMKMLITKLLWGVPNNELVPNPINYKHLSAIARRRYS
jgi:hypothetical protein